MKSVYCNSSWMVCKIIFCFEFPNPWKVPRNWIAFYQKTFVLSPGLLYHLIRRETGRFANDAFPSNPIISSKQYLSGRLAEKQCVSRKRKNLAIYSSSYKKLCNADFPSKHFSLFEIYTLQICRIFVYEHTEKIEHVNK